MGVNTAMIAEVKWDEIMSRSKGIQRCFYCKREPLTKEEYDDFVLWNEWLTLWMCPKCHLEGKNNENLH